MLCIFGYVQYICNVGTINEDDKEERYDFTLDQKLYGMAGNPSCT